MWIVLVDERRVVVVTPEGDATYGLGATLPAHAALPALAPAVDDLFPQVEGAA
ncbi:MAG: hypothetical protein KIT14_06610 [bacterium]|nr:hypothetical protein [bacterium]